MNPDKQFFTQLISTTSLAKEIGISTKDLFQMLIDAKLIMKSNDNWQLTEAGISYGGQYRDDKKYGRHIVWPPSVVNNFANSEEKKNLLTSTTIGKSHQMSPNRVNSILSELGWIKKDSTKGWHVTAIGKRLGGVEDRHSITNVPFVRWPESIRHNPILLSNIGQSQGETTAIKTVDEKDGVDNTSIRDKYRAELRAKDGHYVRSKAELIIDNTLYDYKIIHAYERKIPVDEEIYCDFYIPTNKVYIEYWGLDDEKYLARKKRKLEIYQKHGYNLIELTDKHMSNLDDILPAKLLEFGIDIE